MGAPTGWVSSLGAIPFGLLFFLMGFRNIDIGGDAVVSQKLLGEPLDASKLQIAADYYGLHQITGIPPWLWAPMCGSTVEAQFRFVYLGDWSKLGKLV